MKQYYAIKEIVTKDDSTFGTGDTVHKLLSILMEIDSLDTGDPTLEHDGSVIAIPLYAIAAYLMMCGRLKEEDIESEDLRVDAYCLMNDTLNHINPAKAPMDIVTDGADSVLEDYNMAIKKKDEYIEYLVV